MIIKSIENEIREMVTEVAELDVVDTGLIKPTRRTW